MSVNNKLSHFGKSLNENLKLFLSISIGLFLFILFFQPFPLERFDYNNKLVFVSGFSGIVLLFMILIRIVLSWIFYYKTHNGNEPILPSSLSGFIIMVLSSVSFAFYLRYVGFVSISFPVIFKVVLICLAPPVVLGLYDLNHELKQQNDALIIERKILQLQLEKYEDDILNKTIEFNSENNTENIKLLVKEIAFIKSADNYVEIVYKEGETFKKKLLRNTLKNVELQLKQYSNFFRCHRICIVNIHYVEKLNRMFNNHWLTIQGYDEQIPVSRQYLIKLKEAL